MVGEDGQNEERDDGKLWREFWSVAKWALWSTTYYKYSEIHKKSVDRIMDTTSVMGGSASSVRTIILRVPRELNETGKTNQTQPDRYECNLCVVDEIVLEGLWMIHRVNTVANSIEGEEDALHMRDKLNATAERDYKRESSCRSRSKLLKRSCNEKKIQYKRR